MNVRHRLARRLAITLLTSLAVTACAAPQHESGAPVTDIPFLTAPPSASVVGSPTTVGSATQPPRAGVPTIERPTTIGTDANGSVIELQVGDVVDVKLDPLGPANWLPPPAAPPNMRLISVTGGYPSARSLDLHYLLTGGNNDELTVTADAECRHAQPACEIALPTWQVTIAVVKPLPSGLPSSVPTLENPSTLGNDADGAVAEFKVGDQVTVALDPPASGENWRLPDASHTGLSLITSSGGYPSNQPLIVHYAAVKAASGSLTAKGGGTAWQVWISIQP